MHDPNYNNKSDLIEIKHLNYHKNNLIKNNEVKLSNLIRNKIENHEYFYGIEISARSLKHTVLDYNLFDVQPLFTSIVWIGDIYAKIQSIDKIPAIQCLNTLKQNGIVLPHLSCYQMTDDKLKTLLNQNDITNVLALRGDVVDENQSYRYAVDLVKEIRKLKGDSISIGIGGYPENHPESKSSEDDLNFLKLKADAGADFIITQICFSTINIKNFIKNCRQNNINIPIIVGIYIPENFQTLTKMIEITKIKIPDELYEKFQLLKNDKENFKKFAEDNAHDMIKDLFDSDSNIYGVQFFTLNQFNSIYKIVKKLFVK